MEIIVCLKQVPDTAEIKIDPATKTLIREGVPSIINPYDTYALETALRLKEKYGGKVTALSMGPEQAKNALKSCLAVGADAAFLVSDRAFGGSDTLATSFILAESIRYLQKEFHPFDLILCGKQAIDGDTAQVGPELAEHLNLPQLTYASDVEIDQEGVLVKRESDDGYDMIQSNIPAVITVVKAPSDLRLPSLKGRAYASRAQIETITAEKLNIDKNRCGLKGSPTKVKKTFTPLRNKAGIKVNGKSAEAAAAELAGYLFNARVI